MARQPDDKPAAKFKSDDSALIRELALLLDETSLTEIEIERAGLRVRVARNISIAAGVPAAAPVAGPPALAGGGPPPPPPAPFFPQTPAAAPPLLVAPPLQPRAPAPPPLPGRLPH